MDKINKAKFFTYFNISNDLLNERGCVIKNDSEITEFKVLNKFFYKVDASSNKLLVHNRICSNFLISIPISNAAIAYRKGYSYLNLFEPHLSGYYFLRLDISSFFNSIPEATLRECFSVYFKEEYIDKGERQSLLDAFIRLVTYTIPEDSLNDRFINKNIVPIGFKTSPAISNIIFRKLDILIQKYCSSKGITYSRYADDMLFSSPASSEFVNSDSFFSEIKYLLSIDGYKINKKKTINKKHTISLNGYIITNDSYINQNAVIRISNKKTKIISKIIHMLDKDKSPQVVLEKVFRFRVNHQYFHYLPPKQHYLEKYCRHQLLNKITGYRSYMLSIVVFDKKYQCVDRLAIEKYLKIIEQLNLHIDKLA